MPPPSCAGIVIAVRIASTAAPLTGLPAKAPFRSTIWRYLKPWASKSAPASAGSSLKTVASLISPSFRRTHLPSLRSIAGKRITHCLADARWARAAIRFATVFWFCAVQCVYFLRRPDQSSLSLRVKCSTWPSLLSPLLRRPFSRRPLTEADAIDIWIARWLRVRRRDLIQRYGCDPRRLYEIWEEAAFAGSRAKALEHFQRAIPGPYGSRRPRPASAHLARAAPRPARPFRTFSSRRHQRVATLPERGPSLRRTKFEQTSRQG